jgi:hypothetical protein
MYMYTTTITTYRCVERSVSNTVNEQCNKEGKITGVRIERETKDNYLVTVERTLGTLESIIKKIGMRRKG